MTLCGIVQPVLRNSSSMFSFSSQTLASAGACWYRRPCLLTCLSARCLSNIYQRTLRNDVRSVLCSKHITAARCEIGGFQQHAYSVCCLPSVARQPVISYTSSPFSSLMCCDEAKFTKHQSHLGIRCSRNYMPRHVTPSKTIIEASPLSLQPYLRLIRIDRPIGM